MSEKLTEKDCLLELERVCRIIAYSRVDDGKDLAFCRKTITGVLEKLAQIRKEKAEKAEARAAAKRAANSRHLQRR